VIDACLLYFNSDRDIPDNSKATNTIDVLIRRPSPAVNISLAVAIDSDMLAPGSQPG
jgi:hypothetical protein